MQTWHSPTHGIYNTAPQTKRPRGAKSRNIRLNSAGRSDSLFQRVIQVMLPADRPDELRIKEYKAEYMFRDVLRQVQNTESTWIVLNI